MAWFKVAAGSSSSNLRANRWGTGNEQYEWLKLVDIIEIETGETGASEAMGNYSRATLLGRNESNECWTNTVR